MPILRALFRIALPALILLFALACGGGGGSSPAPPPAPPIIASFTATPATIQPGQCATLAWAVSGATTLRLDPGVGDVMGKTSQSVTPVATTTYTLTASHASGTVSAQVTLTVAPPPKGTLYRDASLLSGGILRYWDTYVPAGLPAKVPVVVVLHGGGQNKDLILDPLRVSPVKEWLEIADESKVLILVPNGVNTATGSGQGTNLNWNDGRGDNTVTSSQNDIAFLGALLDWAGAHYPIDPQRIYFTGASNGGLMSYRVAQELSHRVAAVAAFIASKPAVDVRGAPEFPISVFICNGSGETLYMPWAGGVVAGNPNSGTVLSAEATRDFWVGFNRCQTTPQVTPYPDLDPSEGSTATRFRYTGGTDGTEVELLIVANGGHVIPSIKHAYNPASLATQGLGIQNHDIEGARVAWEFLCRQVLGQTRPAPPGIPFGNALAGTACPSPPPILRTLGSK